VRSSKTTVPGNGPLLFRSVQLTHADLIARAGLKRIAPREGEAQSLTIADPFARATAVPDGGRVEWRGSIYWPFDRALTVTASNNVPTSVRIAGIAPMMLEPGIPVRLSVQLPRGWRPVEIDEDSGNSGLSLAVDDGAVRPFTRWDLRPEPGLQGLDAVSEAAGRAPLHTIDPQIDAFTVEGFFHPPNRPLELAAPFTAAWEGSLVVEWTGTYSLEARGSGPFSLSLDGSTILDERRVKPLSPQLATVTCDLVAGSHALTARWTALTAPSDTVHRMFQLYWTPPGGTRALIPPPSFTPHAPEMPVEKPATCKRGAAIAR